MCFLAYKYFFFAIWKPISNAYLFTHNTGFLHEPHKQYTKEKKQITGKSIYWNFPSKKAGCIYSPKGERSEFNSEGLQVINYNIRMDD